MRSFASGESTPPASIARATRPASGPRNPAPIAIETTIMARPICTHVWS